MRGRRTLNVVLLLGVVPVPAMGGVTTLVSVGLAGDAADDFSTDPVVSADGRFVAFESAASNLVPEDGNGVSDIFVRDRVAGLTTRVSVATGGGEAGNASVGASISADGRFVAFLSFADNLIANDSNPGPDAFVHDRLTGETVLASVSSTLEQANNPVAEPAISGDGRYVAFVSEAMNLVPDDLNFSADVFRHDMLTGQTILVSVASDGTQADHFSEQPALSFDGRYVAFVSRAGNLDPVDPNLRQDVYVHDCVTGATTLVSANADAIVGDDDSDEPTISDDGRYVAFLSWASNLIVGELVTTRHAYLYDRLTSTMLLVSRSFCNEPGNGRVDSVDITPDATWCAVSTYSTDMIGGGTYQGKRIFLRNLLTQRTVEISVDDAGNSGNYDSYDAILSDDGQTVIFESSAENLVPDDDNEVKDIFAHEVAIPCATDLDGNGAVGIADLLALLGCWGPCAECGADVDLNGTTGITDLLQILGAWGPCTP